MSGMIHGFVYSVDTCFTKFLFPFFPSSVYLEYSDPSDPYSYISSILRTPSQSAEKSFRDAQIGVFYKYDVLDFSTPPTN